LERALLNGVRRLGAIWIVPAVYIGLAVAVTFPFVLHPQSTLTAPLGGDVAGSVSTFQTIVREHKSPFTVAHLVTIGYPDGVTTHPGVNRVAFLNTAFLWVTSIGLGAMAAHGLLTILGFWLTAIVTFLFVRRVTGSNGAGFVAGLAYGFWPHMYLIATAAPTYTHMWMLLLPVWAWFELALGPTLRRAAIAGLAPLPAMFWTPYYTLHVTVIIGACLLVIIIRALVARRISGRALALGGLALAVPALAGVAIVVILAFSQQSGVPTRPLEDAFQESAHPLMYLLPGHGSIWGAGPYDLLVRIVPRAEYSNSYVGISVIVLSVVALSSALAAWLRSGARALSSPLVLATLMAAAVVIACFVFSLPPHLARNRIPTPAALVIALQPAFRAGQRFVMPLMGGMTILAGLGVNVILRRVASHRAALALVIVIALVVGLDLFARRLGGTPTGVTPIPPSAALAMLAAQPQGPAFEFVDHGHASPISGMNPCLLQPQHGKILVQSCQLGPESSDVVRWDATRTCDTVIEMRKAGVKYVIVDAAITNMIACLDGPVAGSDEKVGADQLVVVYRLN
jgi:hypothetical protein